MKIPKLLLLLSLVILLSEIVVVVAQEEEGGGETAAEAETATTSEEENQEEVSQEEVPEADSTSSEETQTTEEEKEEGESKSQPRKNFNGPQKNADGEVEINCDHKCGGKLRVETMELNRVKNILGKKLLGRSMHAQAVTEQSEKYTERHERAKIVQNEEKEKADVVMKELEASRRAESTAKKNLVNCQTSSETWTRTLEAELKTLEQEIEYYEGLRFYVNVENIKSDIKDFLKKYSLIKD